MSAAVLKIKEQLHDFSIHIEAGCEEMYLAMRDMRPVFSAADLARASGATEGAALFYLTRLNKRGIVPSAGMSTDRQPLFGKPKLQITPIVLDQDGSLSLDFTRRQSMWTALRALRTFTVSELFDIVCQHVKIDRPMVNTYIDRLAKANYLTRTPSEDGDEDGFMLRTSMDTGRIAPKLCEAELVFDISRRAFFGRGVAREVALA